MTEPMTSSDNAAVLRIADLSSGGIDWQDWFALAMPPDTSWQDAGRGAAADLDTLLASGTRTLVIYDAPGTVLEQALRQGHPPGTALDDWKTCARTILKAYRRHRRTTFLVESGVFAGAPRLLAERLGNWSRIALRCPAPREGTAAPVPSPTAVAVALAHGVSGIGELADELETGGIALQPGAEPDPAALDGFFESFVPRARLSDLEAERDAIAEARDAAEAQAEKLSGRLEVLAAKAEALRVEAEARAVAGEEITLLTDQLAAMQERLEQEHSLRRSLEDEALPAARSRLDAAERERDDARAETAQLRGRLTREHQDLQRELDESRKEIARLLNSRSMRITAPLRAVIRLGGRGHADG